MRVLLPSGFLLVVAAAVAPLQAQSPEQFGAYGGLGRSIGLSGLLASDATGTMEIYADCWRGEDATSNWVAFRFDPVANVYRHVYVSPADSRKIREMHLGNVLAGPGLELVLLYEWGDVAIYDQGTRALVQEFSTQLGQTNAMDLHDFDGDGREEIAVSDGSRIDVYDGNGQIWGLWQGIGGDEILVGQFDLDPAWEIAATDGRVVDTATGQIQCDWPAGFGKALEKSDFDGDGMEELLFAENFAGNLWAFDVDLVLPKWSFLVSSGGIDSLLVADVDGNGAEEILVGTSQSGGILVYDLPTQTQLMSVSNLYNSGTTNMAVSDLDADGQIEVAWGSGHTSSGSDHMHVADLNTGALEWETLDLVGPFFGPEYGDLDGDGVKEIVVATWEAESGYRAGRILVLDEDLELLGWSPDPVWPNPRDEISSLGMYDVDSDNRMEILVGTETTSGGMIEVWEYFAGTFFRTWHNTTMPASVRFSQVWAGDVDSDGQLEFVGGATETHPTSAGTMTYVFDYATGTVEWSTGPLGTTNYPAIVDLQVADLDADPALEIVTVIEGGEVYVHDAATRAQEAVITGVWVSALALPDSGRLLLGDALGNAELYEYVPGSGYVPTALFPLTAGAVDGVTLLSGGALVGSEGRLQLFEPPLSAGPVGTTPFHGEGFGAQVLFLGGNRVVTVGSHAVIGYQR